MAEIITIGGQRFTRRKPLGAWGLYFLTLGIYFFVWHFKVNDEARRFLGDERIRPGISLLAVTLGALVIIPAYVSIYRTGQRIALMEERAGVPEQISPAIGLLAAFVLALHIVVMQEHLNKVWGRYVPVPAAAPPGGAAPSVQPAAGAAPAGSPPLAPPSPVSPPPPWSPSHAVPADGLTAWGGPDPAGPRIASLDPGLLLQVRERRGDWAEVVASNGWSGWVDARLLEEVRSG
jgi:hypothetical protein